AASGVRVMDADHATVIAAKRRAPTAVLRMPLGSVEPELWTALARVAAKDVRTFFVVQSIGLSASSTAFPSLLEGFRAHAPHGSEMVFNVLSPGDARLAGVAIAGISRTVERPIAGARTGEIVVEAKRLGLPVRGVFDSRDLQRRHVGSGDLFVCETYLWIATGTRDGKCALRDAALDALTSATDQGREVTTV